MARKARVWNTKPTGRPTRECESCHKFYFPRLKQCPECGAPNPKMAGVSRKVKRRAPRRGAAGRGGDKVLDAAIQFIQAAGGIENARATLGMIEQIRRL